MATALKHVGKIKNTGTKVLIVFRTLPGESNYALVLPVAQLPDAYHDSLMSLVETPEAQEAFEFGEIMFARHFPDGRPMLRAMQADNRLQKFQTDLITVCPTPVDEIPLDQLNVLIAEQKNVAVDELYTFVKGAPKKNETEVVEAARVNDISPKSNQESSPSRAQAADNSVLTDVDLAKSYRSQADAMYKEAARLRKQADELDPPKRKTTKVAETSDA